MARVDHSRRKDHTYNLWEARKVEIVSCPLRVKLIDDA